MTREYARIKISTQTMPTQCPVKSCKLSPAAKDKTGLASNKTPNKYFTKPCPLNDKGATFLHVITTFPLFRLSIFYTTDFKDSGVFY